MARKEYILLIGGVFLSSFALKIIAIISMVFDHTIVVFNFPDIYRSFGRIAFPIFALMAAEGCKYTKNIKHYMLRLLIFAFISEPIYDIIFNEEINFLFDLNVIFTLFISCLAIFVFEFLKKYQNIFFGFLVVFLFATIAGFFKTDYGFFGVILVFMLYIFKSNKGKLLAITIFASAIYYPVILGAIAKCFSVLFLSNFETYFHARNIYYYIFTLASGLFISLYNGKRGFKIKYLFYIFYPLHLFILFVLKNFVF